MAVWKVENEKEWLEARLNLAATASDVSVLLGLNPWKSIDQLYDEKVNGKQMEINSEAISRGKHSEPHLRALTEIDLIENYKTHVAGEYHPFWIYVDDECPCLGATLDGIIYRQDWSFDITEYKTGTRKSSMSYQEEWGTDEMPMVSWNYLPQVYAQLACVPDAKGNIVRPRITIKDFNGTSLPRIKECYRYIPRDELTEQWINTIRQIVWDFNTYVKNKVRPPKSIVSVKRSDLCRLAQLTII